MNVADLKDLLSRLPDDMPVCIEGHEGGITEWVAPEITPIRRNAHQDPWHGEHERDYRRTSKDEVLILARVNLFTLSGWKPKRPRKKSRRMS